MRCGNCDIELNDTGDRCIHCGEPLEAPNVRWAKKERSWLDDRHKDAIDDAQKRGCHPIIEDFGDQVSRASAVINVDINDLYSFITKENKLYSTYQHLTEAEERMPASFENESQRLIVEGTLFAGYGKKIRYAALSLKGKGLSSYGNATMILDDRFIEKRATALETNSYKFLERHPDKPPGYVSTWHEKSKLAVAKYSDQIKTDTTENQFEDILLFSDGNRSTDEFIEVLIYGPISSEAIRAVRVTSHPKGRLERVLHAKIRETLQKKRKGFIQE